MKIRIEIEINEDEVGKILAKLIRAIHVVSGDPKTFDYVLTALMSDSLEKVEE